jgi:histidine ammonia-lyase
MGLNTALKNGQILDNAYGVLGIEFMAAAQALDFLLSSGSYPWILTQPARSGNR